MASKKFTIGIIGGGGYTAGELLRILLHHPAAEIRGVYSRSQTGKPVTAVHRDLQGECDLHFSTDIFPDVDVLFLCSGHGKSAEFLGANPLPEGTCVIDLSQDFRDESQGFVYGLPELNRERIRTARKIANPGCFATAIQLALLPLAKAGKLPGEVHVSAITGSTGAGQAPTATTHFSWRSHNISVYKPFQHQHLAEILRSLAQLQPGFTRPLRFIPFRGSFTRGILASVYLQTDLSLKAAEQMFADYYANHPFVHLSAENIDVKQVVNTNKALLHLERHGDVLLIVSAIDNLTKGAAGQAVQNMNLMFGLPETMGLRLKPVGF